MNIFHTILIFFTLSLTLFLASCEKPNTETPLPDKCIDFNISVENQTCESSNYGLVTGKKISITIKNNNIDIEKFGIMLEKKDGKSFKQYDIPIKKGEVKTVEPFTIKVDYTNISIMPIADKICFNNSVKIPIGC